MVMRFLILVQIHFQKMKIPNHLSNKIKKKKFIENVCNNLKMMMILIKEKCLALNE